MESEDHQQSNESTRINVVNPQVKEREDAREEAARQEEEKRQKGSKHGRLGNMLGKKVFGTFVYVYFAAFVIFHVALMLIFLLTNMNPWAGLLVWLAMTILGGVCVVALSLWRDDLRTFWD